MFRYLIVSMFMDAPIPMTGEKSIPYETMEMCLTHASDRIENLNYDHGYHPITGMPDPQNPNYVRRHYSATPATGGIDKSKMSYTIKCVKIERQQRPRDMPYRSIQVKMIANPW